MDCDDDLKPINARNNTYGFFGLSFQYTVYVRYLL